MAAKTGSSELTQQTQTGMGMESQERAREASVRCDTAITPQLSTSGALHLLPRQHIKAGLQSGIK